MNTTAETIPPRLEEIIEDFGMCEGREKLELLLEFSDRMPPLPEWLKTHHELMDQVHECMTPVFIHVENNDGKLNFTFDVPPEAPTIRGYAALLAEGLNGVTPQQVLAVPADFFQRMGLHQVLSPQRMNGISAILAYMKRLAVKEMRVG